MPKTPHEKPSSILWKYLDHLRKKRNQTSDASLYSLFLSAYYKICQALPKPPHVHRLIVWSSHHHCEVVGNRSGDKKLAPGTTGMKWLRGTRSPRTFCLKRPQAFSSVALYEAYDSDLNLHWPVWCPGSIPSTLSQPESLQVGLGAGAFQSSAGIPKSLWTENPWTENKGSHDINTQALEWLHRSLSVRRHLERALST